QLLGAEFAQLLLTPAARCGSRHITVGETRLDRGERLAADLRVGIDEVVEGCSHLWRVEDQIAPEGELDAVLVVRAEKVVAFGRILGRLGRINRHPADAWQVELRPAVIAAHLPGPSVGGQREPDGETRGNPDRPAVPNKDGVKVGAVSPPRLTGVVDVAPPPALPAFVVLHGGD